MFYPNFIINVVGCGYTYSKGINVYVINIYVLILEQNLYLTNKVTIVDYVVTIYRSVYDITLHSVGFTFSSSKKKI